MTKTPHMQTPTLEERIATEEPSWNDTCTQKTHYENTPIQIYWKFYNQKRSRGGSYEYPQSMFLSRNKKNNL